MRMRCEDKGETLRGAELVWFAMTLLFLVTLSLETSAQLNSWSASNQTPSTIIADKAV
jgi:hypothetical protein